MTTLAQFLAALASADVPAQTRYSYPPTSLNAADLPALWVELPSAEDVVIAFQGGQHWPTLKARLVLALSPVAQSTQPANFAAAVQALDGLANALRRLNACASHLRFSLRVAVVEVAGAAFWAIIADVEGRG